jgi:hypothetical protein
MGYPGGPAVDNLVAWLSTINRWQLNGGIMVETTNALAKAALLGNQKAEKALEKLAVAHPAGSEQGGQR